MGRFLPFYASLTASFGQRRRLVRRIGGLCLVVLGVHTAADLLDDLVVNALDGIDRGLDALSTLVLSSLARDGVLAGEDAARLTAQLIEWMTPEGNEELAKFVALAAELVVEAVLLPFLWGTRPSPLPRGRGMREQLLLSLREFLDVVQPVDLERLAVAPTLLAFSLTGSLGAALAAESFCSTILAEHFPGWGYGAQASAALALLAACGLVWRFVPDLLQGALLRSKERALRDLLVVENMPAAQAHEGSLLVARLRRRARGSLMFCVILPLALVTLLTQTRFPALLARLGDSL